MDEMKEGKMRGSIGRKTEGKKDCRVKENRSIEAKNNESMNV